jgi:hypothetical protein
LADPTQPLTAFGRDRRGARLLATTRMLRARASAALLLALSGCGARTEIRPDSAPPPAEPGPCDVPAGSVDVVALALGDNSSCALTRTGDVHCWGSTTPHAATSATPKPARIGGLAGVTHLACTSTGRCCAATNAGDVACFRAPRAGSGVAPNAALAGATKLAGTLDRLCGLGDDGGLRCDPRLELEATGNWVGLALIVDFAYAA